MVAIALKEGLDPIEVDTKKSERLTMFIQPLLSVKIEAIAEKNGLSFQEAFAGLTAAGIRSLKKDRSEMTGVAILLKPPFKNIRPEQLQYFQGVQSGLLKNKIVLAELSTGVGKGRVICVSAILAAEENKKPVLIAAPTLKVLGQLWTEMNKLRKDDGLGKTLTFGFFPGATEFINETRLIEFMSEHEKEDIAVEKWIRSKGKMLESKNPLREAMIEIGIKPTWLIDDLRTLVVNMPSDDFALRSGEECAATDALKKIRDRVKKCDIIFCTHAMLAYSNKTQWALLPEPSVLMIDEAHMFENAVAGVYSDTVSLFSLKGRISKMSKSPATTIKAIGSFLNYLSLIHI